MADLLEKLSSVLPEGVPVPARWLHERGFSRALLHAYATSGWLEALPGGAYRRPGPELIWPAALYGAQEAGLPVHVGHLSALSAHGLAHYLTLGPVEAVHCYLPSRPPAWLARLPFDLRWHAGRVIADPAGVGQPSAGLRRPSATVPAALKLGVERATRLPWPAVVSGPERAALELAAGLTRGGSWDVAYETFEGLGGLRPALVQALLEACPSVVTKRLFLHLAARAGHAWLSRLDLAGVDLGHGKRQVVPGGRLDPTFRVTVPREEDGGGG